MATAGVEKYERLIYKYARSYPVPFTELEDRVQIGRIGAWKALNTFKSEKGVKEITWVGNYIRYELLNEQERYNKKSNRDSDLVSVTPEHYENLGDSADFTNRLIDLMEIHRRLSSYGFTEREADIYWKIRFLGYRYDEITELYGISRARIGQILEKVLKKMRSQHEGTI